MWHCVGIGLTAFSLLLNIVGQAIPYWYYVTVPDYGTVYIGLWQASQSTITRQLCSSSFIDPFFCGIGHVLVISGGVASMAALLAGVSMLLFMKKKNVSPKVAGVVAGIFNIVAGNYLTVKLIYTSSPIPLFID